MCVCVCMCVKIGSSNNSRTEIKNVARITVEENKCSKQKRIFSRWGLLHDEGRVIFKTRYSLFFQNNRVDC